MSQTRNLECACCGESAGRWQQHWNRDTGYGVCRKCIDWMLSRGTSVDEIKDSYGIEGVNYQGQQVS